MGGLIKAPSTKATTAAAASVDTSAQTAAAAEKAAQERRIAALEQQRAGRAGTITTSDRGLLDTADWVPQRKTLLGE